MAFLAKRFVETSDLTEYTDSVGRLVEKRVDKEPFILYNARGEKQLITPARYQVNYYHCPTLSLVYEYFSGRPIRPPSLLEMKEYNFRLSQVDSGTSQIVQDFIEEWGWLVDSPGAASIGQELGVKKGVITQPRPEFKTQASPHSKWPKRQN